MGDLRRGGEAGPRGTAAASAWYRWGLTSVMGAVALVALGCGQRKLPFEPSVQPTPNPSATFSRVQAVVFTPNCAVAGCHSTLGPQQGMSLAAGMAYGNTVRVPSVERPDLNRIEPGDPDRSYLVKKLRGDPDITGVRMPDGGTLTPDEIQLVIDWVRRGAPNN
ncbi:MAG TPA: hypothetical protein VMT19_10330 [Thermoanaerobaculaceae bacterium]|nr:hypothetical protein [Thermoanaerobaculaceae bacterium]